MTLWGYLQICRNSWRGILLCTLAGLLLAGAVSIAMPRVYSAQARLFVSSGIDNGSAYQNGQFAMARVKSYTLLVDSPNVLRPVIDDLGLTMSVRELSDDVTAENPVDTALIDVGARSGDPDTAVAIANAASRQLSSVIERVERPKAGGTTPVKASLTVPAGASTRLVSPRMGLNLALGLLVGLAVGVSVGVLRDQLGSRPKSGDAPQPRTGPASLALVGVGSPTGTRTRLTRAPGSRNLGALLTLRANLAHVDTWLLRGRRPTLLPGSRVRRRVPGGTHRRRRDGGVGTPAATSPGPAHDDRAARGGVLFTDELAPRLPQRVGSFSDPA